MNPLNCDLVRVLRLAAPLLLSCALLAAPQPSTLPGAADPLTGNNQIHWFTLNETRADVARALGLPAFTSSFGDDFESWQYRLGETEEEGYSHQLVFRKSTGRLISIARNYFPERSVDELLPDPDSAVYWYPDAAHREFCVRLRRMEGGLILLATGVATPGQKTSQIFLTREETLPVLFPWIANAISSRQQP